MNRLGAVSAETMKATVSNAPKAEGWMALLFRGGSHLVSTLKNPKVLVPVGLVLVVYSLYRRYMKVEEAPRVYPDDKVLLPYIASIQKRLDNGELDRSTGTNFLKACPNYSITAEQVVEKLRIPESLDLSLLETLYNSPMPLTKEVGYLLLQQSLAPLFASVIQECLDSKKEIQIANNFFSHYPKEFADNFKPERVVALMNANSAPTLERLKVLFETAQGPAKAVIGEIYASELARAYCEELQKKLEHAKNANEINLLTYEWQHVDALQKNFPNYSLKAQDVIEKFTYFSCPTLEQLGKLNLKGLGGEVVAELKKTKQREADIIAFADAVHAHIEKRKGVVFKPVGKDVTADDIVNALNPLRLSTAEALEKVPLPTNPLAKAVVQKALERVRREEAGQKYFEAAKAFVQYPRVDTAAEASAAFDRARAFGMQRYSRSGFIPELMEAADANSSALMDMRSVVKGDMSRIVDTLLLQQVHAELFERATKKEKAEHPYVTELKAKIKELEGFVHYEENSELSSFGSGSLISKGDFKSGSGFLKLQWRKSELDHLKSRLTSLEKFQLRLTEATAFADALTKEELAQNFIRHIRAGDENVASWGLAIEIKLKKNSGYFNQFVDSISSYRNAFSWSDLQALETVSWPYPASPEFNSLLEYVRTLYASSVFKKKPSDKKDYWACPAYKLAIGEDQNYDRYDIETLAMAHVIDGKAQSELKKAIEKRLSNVQEHHLAPLRKRWSEEIKLDTTYHLYQKIAFKNLLEWSKKE